MKQFPTMNTPTRHYPAMPYSAYFDFHYDVKQLSTDELFEKYKIRHALADAKIFPDSRICKMVVQVATIDGVEYVVSGQARCGGGYAWMNGDIALVEQNGEGRKCAKCFPDSD